ncbi:MAG: hypothetical protein OET90_05830 [Desulfuromonadales bacterium]|nr:hypothetical protein [Desulfuromonadales bacterium]
MNKTIRHGALFLLLTLACGCAATQPAPQTSVDTQRNILSENHIELYLGDEITVAHDDEVSVNEDNSITLSIRKFEERYRKFVKLQELGVAQITSRTTTLDETITNNECSYNTRYYYFAEAIKVADLLEKLEDLERNLYIDTPYFTGRNANYLFYQLGKTIEAAPEDSCVDYVLAIEKNGSEDHFEYRALKDNAAYDITRIFGNSDDSAINNLGGKATEQRAASTFQLRKNITRVIQSTDFFAPELKRAERSKRYFKGVKEIDAPEQIKATYTVNFGILEIDLSSQGSDIVLTKRELAQRLPGAFKFIANGIGQHKFTLSVTDQSGDRFSVDIPYYDFADAQRELDRLSPL